MSQSVKRRRTIVYAKRESAAMVDMSGMSGSQVINMNKGRVNKLPRVVGTLPNVGDCIVYNLAASCGFDDRGIINNEKRGCMVVTNITKALVCGYYFKRCGNTDETIKLSVSLSKNDFLYGKAEYVKISSPIADNFFDYDALEIVREKKDIASRIVLFPAELKEKVLV